MIITMLYGHRRAKSFTHICVQGAYLVVSIIAALSLSLFTLSLSLSLYSFYQSLSLICANADAPVSTPPSFELLRISAQYIPLS